MDRFKKILLSIFACILLSTSVYAGSKYYVDTDGVIHASSITTLSGQDHFTISTNTVIVGDLLITGDFDSGLRADLEEEIVNRINADNLIGSATGQIRIDFEEYDVILNISTSTLRIDIEAEITNRINEDNLISDATGQIRADLNIEIGDRASEDDLISDATGQIRTDFEAYDTLLNTSTGTLRIDLASEIASRISEDDLISEATGQIRIDFEAYDAILNTSTSTLRSDLASEISTRISEDDLISDATGQIRTDFETYDSLLTSATEQLQTNIDNEETARINQDTLIAGDTDQLQINISNEEIARGAYDDLLTGATEQLQSNIDALEIEVEDSTNTLQGNIDTEETARIDQDILIGSATGQIRIDFEAYDSLLNTSTGTLRVDVTNLETSTSTLEGYIFDLYTSTATLEADLATEISDRISEDDLISDATGQIRTDFEAYDSLLNISTGTLRTDVTNLETSTATLEGYIFDLYTSTATLEEDLATEILSRISEDDLISEATGQIRIDFEAYDSLLNTSTSTLRTDVTNLETSTSTLEVYVFDLWVSTSTLEENLDIEISDRINADDLIGSATEQIRTDFETYDSILNTSTGTLRTDLFSEISTRISEDDLISEATGQIRTDFETYDSLLNDSTTQLQTDLNTEINDRISEDNLISDATGQIRTNFEAYDSLLNTSTSQLQIDLEAEETARIDQDILIAGDTDQLQINIGSEETARINADILIGSATEQIRIDFEAYDSILDTTSLVSNDLLRWDGTNLVRIASGTVAGQYLRSNFTWSTPSGGGDMLRSVYDIGENNIVDNSEKLNGQSGSYYAIKANVISSTNTLQSNINTEINIRTNEISSLTTTYLGITAKADDSDLLDGYNYDHFVDTNTAQSISGNKTFNNDIIVLGDNYSSSIYLESLFGMRIYSDFNTLKMYQGGEILNTYEYTYNTFKIPGSLYLGKNLPLQYLYFGETTDEYIRGDATNNNIRIGTGGIDRAEITDSSITLSVDIRAEGYEIFADTITGVFIGYASSSTYADNSGLLGGNASYYYAIRADVATDTTTIQGNLDTEEIARIDQDALIGSATGQIRVDFEAYDALLNTSTGTLRIDFEAYDSILNTSTGTLRTDITNLEISTSTLEGYVFDLWASTATLESDLATEISDRASEDDLISNATGQIRIDFEAYDALLNTSTGTLRTDVTNLEISTATLEGYIFDLYTSTATLESDLATEISDRISEDDLISDATGQIRIDFEAYDALLNTSTGTLRTDLGIAETAITNLETSTSTLEGYVFDLWDSTATLESDLATEISDRISEDDLISDATGQIRADLDQVIIDTGTFLLRGGDTVNGDLGINGSLIYQTDKYIVCSVFTSTGINACIDALGAEGGEVYLPEGTYNCTTIITIDCANTTLTGAGAGTILDASAGFAVATVAVIDTNDLDYVTIRNLKIIGSAGVGQITNLIGDGDDADYLSVQNCWLYRADTYGIRSGGEGVAITECYFDDNDANDIHLAGTHCIISNNTLLNAGGYGIDLLGSATYSIISNNYFFGTGTAAIYLFTPDYCSVIGNTIFQCRGGIRVYDGSEYTVITGNTIYDSPSGFADIFMSGDYNTITGNTCIGDGTSDTGIWLTDGDQCVVTGNITKGHDVAGIREDNDCESNLIYGNNCQDTIPYILNGTASAPFRIDNSFSIDKTSATCYTDVYFSSDTYWTEAGSGIPYGATYGNHIGWSQATAAQDTWYNISDADMVDGELNLVTADSSGKLTVSKAGRYLINYSITLESSANIHVDTGIEITGSGTANAAGISHIETKFLNQEEAMSGTAILSLAANATIEIAVMTIDATTPTIAVQDLCITAVMVGG